MEDTKILIIDDEKNILESIKMVLAYENYQVETSGSGLDGVELFKTFRPDIVLLDVKMPGFDGIEVLKNHHDFRPFRNKRGSGSLQIGRF
jgi:DNA-binding response OmpR family regulator